MPDADDDSLYIEFDPPDPDLTYAHHLPTRAKCSASEQF